MDNQVRTRNTNACRIAGILAAVMLALVVFGLLNHSNYFGVGSWLVLAAASVGAIVLTRREHRDLGVALMLGVALVLLPFSSFVAQGAGMLQGLVAIALSGVCAYLALSPRWRIWALVAGGVSAATCVALDIFGSAARPLSLNFTTTVVITLAILALYSIFVLRHFSKFSIREKIIVVALALTLIPLAILAVINNRTSEQVLTQRAGIMLENLADTQALHISTQLEQQVRGLNVLALDSTIAAAVTDANAAYPSDAAARRAELEKLDQTWRAADAANNDADPLVASRLKNAAAEVLRHFRIAYPDNVEVFVTDRYGATVAATNRTSDYFQGDEEWWQAAYNNGQGAVYIGQPSFDASSQTDAINIAAPLYDADGKTVEGVVRTTYSIQALYKLLAAIRPGQSGHADILLPDNRTIGFDFALYDTAVLDQIRAAPGETIEIASPDSEPRLYNRAAVQAATAGAVGAAVANLDWTLLVHQDRAEVLAPIEAQTRGTVILALVIALVGAVVSLAGAELLARPIMHLTATAERVRAGDLHARAPIETQDEIGELAATFNQMTEQLGGLVGNLEQRVADRTIELESNNAYYVSLQDTSVALLKRRDVEALLQDIIERAGELVGTKNGYVFLLDHATQEMVMRVGVGTYNEFVGTKAKRGTGLAGQVWQSGEALVVDDYQTWSGRLADPSRNVLRAVIGVPLKSGEQVSGVIGLAHLEAGKRFGPTEVDVLKRFAALAALALDNAELLDASRRELAQRQNTEQFLDSLLENLPTMLFVKDARDLRFVRWNKAGEQIVGRSRAELIGRHEGDFFPIEEAEFILSRDRETLASGQTLDIPEEPIETASGEIRWLHTRKVPILDAAGKPLYLLGISEDITEQKRAQDSLRASEERYRAITQSANDAIIVADAQGTILGWNQGAEKAFQYTAAEALGQPLTLIIPEQYRALHDAGIHRVTHGGEPHIIGKTVELMGLRKDGAEFPIEISLTNWKIGTDNFYSGILRDITERKRVEQKARESEEQYRDLFENANDLIQVVNADGSFLYVNRAWKETFGYAEQELETLRFIDIVHPDNRAQAVEVARRVLAGETLTDIRGAFVTKDGRTRDLEGSASPRIVDGQVVSTRSIFRDMTERKRAQEQEAYQNALIAAQYSVSPDGILVVGPDDRILSANRRFAEIWDADLENIADSSMDVMRQSARDKIADSDAWLNTLREIYQHPDASSHDELVFRDGRIFERYSAPVTAADGSYLARIWYLHEITKMRRAESLAQQISQDTHSIFWSARVTKLADETAEACGFHWETEYANLESFRQLYQLREEPGQPLPDVWFNAWDKQDAAQMNRRSADAFREGRERYTQEFRIYDVHGATHWILEEARVRQLSDSEFLVTGVDTDITEIKTTEEALRRNEALYRSLVDVLPQGLTRKDREGRVTFANAYFFQDTLLKPEDAYGKTDFDFHPRELAEKYWQDDLRVLRGGETIDTIEPHQRGDGTNIIVRVLKTPLRDAAGEIDGMQIMFWDITEEQRRQEQIRQQNEYLNALQETSIGLMQRLDVNALLQDIVVRAGQLVGTEHGYVFIKEPGAKEMDLRVGVGAYEGFVGRHTKPGVGLAGQVWESDAPVTVDDYRTWGGRLADASRDILRAVAGVPLRSGSEVIGVIGLAYLDENHIFGEQEIAVLQRFAQLAAIALDNARLYESAQDELAERARAERLIAAQANRIRALLDISLELGKPEAQLAQLLDLISLNAKRLLDVDGTDIWLPVSADEIEIQISHHGGLSTLAGRRLKRGEGLAGRALETGAEIRVDDYREWEYRSNVFEDAPFHAALAIPMTWQGETIGVLAMTHSQADERFTDQDVQIAKLLATQAAAAITNTRLFEAAQKELHERTRAEAALAQQLRETELLNRVTGHAVNLDAEQALHEICRDLAGYFRVEQVGIALLNAEHTIATVVADYSPPGAPRVTGYEIPVRGNPSTEIVLETRKPAAFADAQNDPRLESVRDLMQTRGTASILIAPLFVRDEIIGTMGIDSQARREFSNQDLALVERVAIAISTALENARLYNSLQQELAERTRAEANARQRNLELESLNRVAGVMMSDTPVATSLEQMARELVTTFHARNCGIALLNPQCTELTVVADALAEGHAQHAVGIVIPVKGNASSEYVIETKRSLVIDDPQNDRMTETIHERMRDRHTTCLVIIPLLAGEQVIGTIGLDTTEEGRVFSADEIRVAETMASQMANAIEKQRLLEATQREVVQRARAEQIQSALFRIADAANTSAAAADFYSTLHALIAELVYAPNMYLALYHPAEDALEFAYFKDTQDARPTPDARRRVPAGKHITTWVIKQGRPLLGDTPTLRAMMERGDIEWFGNMSFEWLGIPLKRGAETFGMFAVQSYDGAHSYTVAEMELLLTLAPEISNAVTRRQEQDELVRRNHELAVLNRVTQAVSQGAELAQTLGAVAREMTEVFQARNCGIALYSADKSELVVVASATRSPDEASTVGVRIPIENNPSTQHVLATRQSLVIADAQTDPLTAPLHDLMKARRTRALMIVPLLSGGQVIGTVGTDLTDPERVFSPEEVRLAETIANQMSSAIARQSLFDQTRERARREQRAREISAHLGRSLDVDVIVQTMARELSQALGASHAVVRMGSADKQANGEKGQI